MATLQGGPPVVAGLRAGSSNRAGRLQPWRLSFKSFDKSCACALGSPELLREKLTAFHRLFEERGLPLAIRSDNGGPFAGRGLYGLSELSVWWLRLGIRLERIAPGCPQQNGRLERMHLTLKQETTRPAAENALQQQARFDAFREEFNTERPHEALGMKTPA